MVGGGGARGSAAAASRRHTHRTLPSHACGCGRGRGRGRGHRPAYLFALLSFFLAHCGYKACLGESVLWKPSGQKILGSLRASGDQAVEQLFRQGTACRQPKQQHSTGRCIRSTGRCIRSKLGRTFSSTARSARGARAVECWACACVRACERAQVAIPSHCHCHRGGDKRRRPAIPSRCVAGTARCTLHACTPAAPVLCTCVPVPVGIGIRSVSQSHGFVCICLLARGRSIGTSPNVH